MIRRRYTISATLGSLEEFIREVRTAAQVGQASTQRRDAFVQRVATDSTEENYYIILLTDAEVHAYLRRNGYPNSITLNSN